MIRHILVTGGAGFIGSNFLRYLKGEFLDNEITNPDWLETIGKQAEYQDWVSINYQKRGNE